MRNYFMQLLFNKYFIVHISEEYFSNHNCYVFKITLENYCSFTFKNEFGMNSKFRNIFFLINCINDLAIAKLKTCLHYECIENSLIKYIGKNRRNQPVNQPCTLPYQAINRGKCHLFPDISTWFCIIHSNT